MHFSYEDFSCYVGGYLTGLLISVMVSAVLWHHGAGQRPCKIAILVEGVRSTVIENGNEKLVIT